MLPHVWPDKVCNVIITMDKHKTLKQPNWCKWIKKIQNIEKTTFDLYN